MKQPKKTQDIDKSVQHFIQVDTKSTEPQVLFTVGVVNLELVSIPRKQQDDSVETLPVYRVVNTKTNVFVYEGPSVMAAFYAAHDEANAWLTMCDHMYKESLESSTGIIMPNKQVALLKL